MAKYRKKPIVIEATQWPRPSEVPPAQGEPDSLGVVWQYNAQASVSNGIIKTLEGDHIVSFKDWIITGVKGEKYPCKPDIFEKNYEKVEEQNANTD